ncbi:hypothetical protein KC19_12G039100 [Ceratodon purpureus]|uniref:Uncharacterized protein n=1 Tax=Ceratodon purpureus TaxID=3225 RepID=A0A8T0G7C8_CERPU|nr:hypothetical protein KC19_12G039100 [Ceratodon purpureus]
MSGPELLPNWTSAKQESVVKGGKGARVPVFRVSMKDYVAWHSRISNLIFFCVLLGTGAILGVVTTLNAVGYLSNPESGFLSTGLTALPPHLDSHSDTPTQSDQPLRPTAVDLLLGSNTTSTPPDVQPQTDPGTVDVKLQFNSTAPEAAENAELIEESLEGTNTTLIDDDSYVERVEVPPSFGSDFILMPHPVDLTTLSDVYHAMSDAELLWRASVGARRRPRPETVTPKIAYMFLTRGPLPLGPLWERYFKGHGDLYSIYIHAHPNYMPNFPPDSAFYRRNIPSKEVFWGKLSVFAAERRLLANALLDPANERFVLLSESCIPITPLPVAYKYFTEAQHSFVEAYFLAGKGGMGRYTRIKDRRKLKPEIMPMQWRKGSQWFEMSRALALMVVSDRKYYPKFEDFLCRDNCICYIDEHYLATVLTILAPSQLANRTSTYIDFSRNTAHPKQWDKKLINEASLKQITSGHNCTYNGKLTQTCHMFSRKFSPDAVEPLLELAATSLGIP